MYGYYSEPMVAIYVVSDVIVERGALIKLIGALWRR